MKVDGAPCGRSLPCRLEAEIQEAQVRAKEEMMQGIQIAREMAQQELSSQRAAYESKIRVLEAELVGARRGAPSSPRFLDGPGAPQGDAALGEEEMPRGSGPSSGLSSLVCWALSFPAPSRGQCLGGWLSAVG